MDVRVGRDDGAVKCEGDILEANDDHLKLVRGHFMVDLVNL